MQTRLALLKILSDGQFHSGERLGKTLGMSRTAIWKHIQALQEMGIDCYSVSGKGYRLADAVELLDEHHIRSLLPEDAASLLSTLEVHAEIDSTNRYLMESIRRGLAPGHSCFAESQTAGRGRRGRQWVSPFARNIYMSCYWPFDVSPAVLSGLGLAVAVGVVRAMRELGIEGVALKWPNDILWQGRKLAGILLEMSAESGGPYHVVIGVGMNVNMPDSVDDIDQAWVDLQKTTHKPISRNEVAAMLLGHLLRVADEFHKEGLAAFVDEWCAADAYADQPVVIHHAQGRVEGRAVGIDSDGSILIETDEGVRRFHSGDVSLRPAEHR